MQEVVWQEEEIGGERNFDRGTSFKGRKQINEGRGLA